MKNIYTGLVLVIAITCSLTLLIVSIKVMIDSNKPLIPISLPEEISLAKEGDILIVEKVTDSIYIGFKH